MNRTPAISLCMIVRNESANLDDCLKTIVGMVDEIIIVDSGSTDRTPDIARSYGALVHSYPWNDSFADARNESLKHAVGDWIIYLDADERFAANQKELLRRRTEDDQAMAFDITISSNLGNEYHCDESIRLFRNVPAIQFEGRIHEQILPSILKLNGMIKKSNLMIEHLGYNATQQDMQQKYKRNERLFLKQIEEHPHDAFSHYCLGSLYDQMNEDQLAMQFYHKSLILNPDQPKALFLIGNKLLQYEQYALAEQCFQHAHTIAPEVSEVLYNLAIAQVKQSRYDEAIVNFQKADRMRGDSGQIQKKIAACYDMLEKQRTDFQNIG